VPLPLYPLPARILFRSILQHFRATHEVGRCQRIVLYTISVREHAAGTPLPPMFPVPQRHEPQRRPCPPCRSCAFKLAHSNSMQQSRRLLALVTAELWGVEGQLSLRDITRLWTDHRSIFMLIHVIKEKDNGWLSMDGCPCPLTPPCYITWWG
jgi:hypothetical protein